MSGEKIVIAEDEAIIAENLRMLLEEFGYEVCGVAATGIEVLVLVERESPALVLMDINLRGEFDGIHTSLLIKNQFEVPTVYITGEMDTYTCDRAKLTDPLGFVTKPFTANDIKVAISLAVRKCHMNNNLDQFKTNRISDE